MHKVNYGMAYLYIVDLLPPLVCEISEYPFRKNNSFSTPLTCTNVASKSSIPSAIRMWKSLGEGLKNLPTITSFKHQLQSTAFQKIQVLSYFAWGNQRFSVLNARLRNSSNVNNNLFINNLLERPFYSWCNVMEDTIHYVLTCNQYRNERLMFLNQLETSNHLASNYYYSEMTH